MLPNGNYIVRVPQWNNNAGAIVWGSARAGVSGQISAANSIVDVQVNRVTVLTNSNYVISASFGNGLGMAAWIDASKGRVGTLSAADGLTGSTANDGVGDNVVALQNGNYVVLSPNWDEPVSATVLDGTDIGAATWGNGTTGLTGTVSAANSLIGADTHDRIGFGGAIALKGGDYVVLSQYRSQEQGGASGAATWASGAGPTSATVAAANSIHGSSPNDFVGVSGMALDNGSYVVQSYSWSNGSATAAGAVTWASGGGPTSLTVDTTNSIVGSTANDHVGGNVVQLANSSYVTFASQWHNTSTAGAGAWTWASGTERTGLVVSAANSRVGSQTNDAIGGSTVALAKGGFVVVAPAWNGSGAATAGAVGWGNGTGALTGAISASNSLVGSTPNDLLGTTVLAGSSGNYIVASSTWDGPAGADVGFARVVNGTTGASGTVSATNSLTGATANDTVGSGGVEVLADGNYVVLSPNVDGAAVDTGAVTWMSATSGLVGYPSASNSLIGSTLGDMIGYDPFGKPFGAEPDGGYLIKSARWHQGASRVGAVSVAGPGGLRGGVSPANSVSVAELNGGDYMSFAVGYTSLDAVVIGRSHDSIVTVVLTPDKTPPTLATPANVTVVAPPGASSAAVTYSIPAANDARSTPTVVCSPPSGSTFPVGVATVTCTATDGAGLTASKTFAVTVSAVADYTPLPPARLADTRPGGTTVDGIDAGTGLRDTGTTLELQVTGRGGVPVDASAATLNVTAVDAQGNGYATVWPCGDDRPTASNLNFTTGATVPNAVLAKIGAHGEVCLFTSQPIQFVVDVNGFAPSTTSYHPLNPTRVIDTRPGQPTGDGLQQGIGAAAADSVTSVQIANRAGVPGDASAVALNVTVTEATAPGYLTVFPCGTQRPTASNVNYVTGSTVANLVVSRIGSGGNVCIYTQSTTHLVADVNGYVPAGGSFLPLQPARLLDTRPGSDHPTIDGQSAGAGLLPVGTVTTVQVAGRGGVPANAHTVVLNVTVTEPAAAGYVTAYPCGIDPPLASNLNFAVGQTVANAVIVEVGSGGSVCLTNSQPTQLITDVTGAFP